MRVSVAGSISPMLYLRLPIWILRLDLYSLRRVIGTNLQGETLTFYRLGIKVQHTFRRQEFEYPYYHKWGGELKKLFGQDFLLGTGDIGGEQLLTAFFGDILGQNWAPGYALIGHYKGF